MAPALTAHRDAYDTLLDDKQPHRRRARASVNNLLMDDDAMGLQSQPSLAKDSQEMEQILSDLGSADIAQADLLQAIKTFESTGEGLSTGDAESMFPLSGFDLGETENSEGDSAEDKIRLNQARLERRTMFYLRRVRILQARAIGKRVAEEVTQTFEKATKGARKDGGGRPMGLKALVKRVETTAALQASAASRSVAGPKYYRAGTSKGDASKAASLGISSGTFNELEDKAGALRFHLSVVKSGLDSDATASSSGAESDDEAVPYNNPHQQPMPIEKRALWTWQKRRAKIAASASWIQAQIQELDYKIRQHYDLQQSVRAAKGPVEFEGEPAGVGGYEGSLPGDTCARMRPLRRDTFRKRRLLQMHNLHIATNKAAKPADIRCSCQYPAESCAVCTGRADATQPPPPFSTLSPAQRVALADPGYHPVLSDVRDISPSVHMEALSSRPWFRPRFTKAWRGAHHASSSRVVATTSAATVATPTTSQTTPKETKQPKRETSSPVRRRYAASASRRLKQLKRLKRGRPPLSRKIKERDRDEDTSTSSHERPRGRPSTDTRGWRRQSYDIDNIVIPQSVAANTRPEILTYKEIITPKWRLMDLAQAPMNNGVVKNIRMSFESDDEDISESAVHARHMRAESRERSRYLRKPRARRANADNANHDQQDPLTQQDPLGQHDPLFPQDPLVEPDVLVQGLQDPLGLADQHDLSDHHGLSDQRDLPNQCGLSDHHGLSDQDDMPNQRDLSDHHGLLDRRDMPNQHGQLEQEQPLETYQEPVSGVPLPPHRPEPEHTATGEHETVRPYSPRLFPLPEDVYRDMLATMPEGYRPSSPEPSPVMVEEEEERSSTLSPMSPLQDFDGDDPHDAEWNPSVEKIERRRSGHR